MVKDTKKKKSEQKSEQKSGKRISKSKSSSEVEIYDENSNVEYVNDFREIIKNYDITKNLSPPILTDYEFSLIIGKRATQIAYGANPLIDIQPSMNYIDIAEEELLQKKVPFIIKRNTGIHTEYWKIEDLEINY